MKKINKNYTEFDNLNNKDDNVRNMIENKNI